MKITLVRLSFTPRVLIDKLAFKLIISMYCISMAISFKYLQTNI